jgi:hypothetical protein
VVVLIGRLSNYLLLAGVDRLVPSASSPLNLYLGYVLYVDEGRYRPKFWEGERGPTLSSEREVDDERTNDEALEVQQGGPYRLRHIVAEEKGIKPHEVLLRSRQSLAP